MALASVEPAMSSFAPGFDFGLFLEPLGRPRFLELGVVSDEPVPTCSLNAAWAITLAWFSGWTVPATSLFDCEASVGGFANGGCVASGSLTEASPDVAAPDAAALDIAAPNFLTPLSLRALELLLPLGRPRVRLAGTESALTEEDAPVLPIAGITGGFWFLARSLAASNSGKISATHPTKREPGPFAEALSGKEPLAGAGAPGMPPK